jgi:DNA-directed RNA polymerase subunit beta
MAFQVANNLRFAPFREIQKIIDLPYLYRNPKKLLRFVSAKRRRRRAAQNMGLQEVFKSVFPIKDFNETASLEFVSLCWANPSTTSRNAINAA